MLVSDVSINRSGITRPGGTKSGNSANVYTTVTVNGNATNEVGGDRTKMLPAENDQFQKFCENCKKIQDELKEKK